MTQLWDVSDAEQYDPLIHQLVTQVNRTSSLPKLASPHRSKHIQHGGHGLWTTVTPAVAVWAMKLLMARYALNNAFHSRLIFCHVNCYMSVHLLPSLYSARHLTLCHDLHDAHTTAPYGTYNFASFQWF